MTVNHKQHMITFLLRLYYMDSLYHIFICPSGSSYDIIHHLLVVVIWGNHEYRYIVVLSNGSEQW